MYVNNLLCIYFDIVLHPEFLWKFIFYIFMRSCFAATANRAGLSTVKPSNVNISFSSSLVLYGTIHSYKSGIAWDRDAF